MQRPLSGVLWLDRRSRHRWHPQNGWLYNASPLSPNSLLLIGVLALTLVADDRS